MNIYTLYTYKEYIRLKGCQFKRRIVRMDTLSSAILVRLLVKVCQITSAAITPLNILVLIKKILEV